MRERGRDRGRIDTRLGRIIIPRGRRRGPTRIRKRLRHGRQGQRDSESGTKGLSGTKTRKKAKGSIVKTGDVRTAGGGKERDKERGRSPSSESRCEMR